MKHAITRCDMIRSSVLPADRMEPCLHKSDPNLAYPPFPWGDDQDFRSVRPIDAEARQGDS